MALSIKDPEADRLARELARRTGETITQAIVVSLRERLSRTRAKSSAHERLRRITALSESMREVPILDDRSPDELVGYDDDGLPH